VSTGLPAALLGEGLVLLLVVGGPLLGVLLVVGVALGVLQAATQINDPALGFLPRAVAAGVVCIVAGPWMMERLAGYFAMAIARMAGN
jgi:flagellar biosynthesis protein FliQ